MMQAQTEMDAIAARLAKDFPAENEGWVIRMVPLQRMIVGSVRSVLLVLLGAVGLVLLIACANIANLLLTRATSRAREIAVRATLGAGRNRIVRQLLTETAVLGLLGGVTGIILAYWSVRSLSSLLPPSLPHVHPIRVDNFVLLSALLLSSFASCAFGLAPALFAVNSNLQSSLREGGGRSGESRYRRRARSFLAAGEIALAVVLLVAAGLLLRSLSKLLSVSPGFEVAHIVKADISLPQFQYSTRGSGLPPPTNCCSESRLNQDYRIQRWLFPSRSRTVTSIWVSILWEALQCPRVNPGWRTTPRSVRVIFA